VRGRLNLFQTAMLRWRELHPYSAIHVVRIDRPLDPSRVAAVIERVLVAAGLTGLVLDVKRRAFEYKGGPASPVLAVHEGEASAMDVVASVLERELNEPFTPDGPVNPFRFFVVDGGASFYLGLAYDHVVAGGESIVGLMKGLVDAYLDQGGREKTHNPTMPAPRPLDRYPPTYPRLLLRHFGMFFSGMRRLPDMAASSRRSVRPRYPGGLDPHNAFAQFRLETVEFAAIIRTAKAWGVTVNDLLLAALLRALAPIVGERAATARRREIGVASIINIRRDLGIAPDTTFGQFLSTFHVSHPMPPGATLRDVSRDVQIVTSRIKRERLYLQSLLAIAAASAIWRFLSKERRHRFDAKNYPVWGAITMLDVDALWSERGARMRPPEYLRAVSTGAPTPLVIAVTTAGGVLHAGISYRTAAYTRAQIDSIAAAMIADARSLICK